MRILLSVLVLAVLTAYIPTETTASAPPESPEASGDWENLQVLPDSLTRDELTAIMRGFTAGLGVKCGFCHVREDGEFIFASDDKAQKETARGMIRMVRQINSEILPAIGREAGHEHDAASDHAPEANVPVSCWTCHRGAQTPEAPPAQEGR